jgi:DNA-binding IclR family transcriptional regulator
MSSWRLGWNLCQRPDLERRSTIATTTGSPEEVHAAPPLAVGKSSAADPADRDGAGLELIAKVDALIGVLESHGEASATEIAQRTGEPLSSVYRLLQSLVGVGWVDRGWRRGTYRLGLLLLTIGGQLEDRLDIRECALPSLRHLLEATGTTSLLCVRRDTRAVCVERLDGQAVRSLAMQLGSSLPLFAGAAPRAILAFLPPAEQRSSLKPSRLPGDPPRPDATAIQADIERVRRDGFAVSDGDVTPGIAALGAPVFNHRGELEAAISISGLRSQILGSSREANIELITSCARDVSRSLGQQVTLRGGRRDPKAPSGREVRDQ